MRERFDEIERSYPNRYTDVSYVRVLRVAIDIYLQYFLKIIG
jgi:hypothetical protein